MKKPTHRHSESSEASTTKRIDSSQKRADDTLTDGTLASSSEIAGDSKAGNRKELPLGIWQVVRDIDETRRRGKVAQRAFQTVLGRWNRPGVPADEIAVQEGIEAQIAAASLGYKPLYFDPWGSECSELLAEELRMAFPSDVEIHAVGDYLFVYRNEAVRPILDGDAAFYRPNGEDDPTAIARVSERGDNGDLLGYGARNVLIPLGARVTVKNEEGYTEIFFVSNPAEAESWAAVRAADIEVYTGRPETILIEYQSGETAVADHPNAIL